MSEGVVCVVPTFLQGGILQLPVEGEAARGASGLGLGGLLGGTQTHHHPREVRCLINVLSLDCIELAQCCVCSNLLHV